MFEPGDVIQAGDEELLSCGSSDEDEFADASEESAGQETIPQSRPMADNQVMNAAGGFVWKIDDLMRLQRFLCLGSEGGTYYTGERELTKENADCILRLIKSGKGHDAVSVIKDFSVNGRTAKQNPIMFGLAICARSPDEKTKKAAYGAVNDICRIPTHLFQFVEYCEKLSSGTGWGRAHRKAVCSWYNQFSDKPKKLAIHVTKYKMRNGWSHLDVLRLAHLKPANRQVGFITRYITKGLEKAKEMYEGEESMNAEDVKNVSEFISAIEELKGEKDEAKVLDKIAKFRLVREHIPTELLGSIVIWRYLLKDMPMTAMIRNLGKMTSLGLLEDHSDDEKIVLGKLRNEKMLKDAKIHPFNVLVALLTYSTGHGDKGKLSWKPNNQIKKALDNAFYMSFKFVEPTGKRFLLAVDVSGSMGMHIMGSSVVCARNAAAAMMMVTLRTEGTCDVVAFCDHLKKMNISKNDSLEVVNKKTDNLPFGGTDCSLPMTWALQQRRKYDVFVVYTDNDTWAGAVHPVKSLRKYRKSMNIPDARLIVAGMASTGFTIADPADPGMLDIVGFDSAAPDVMKRFIMGEI